MPVPVISGEGLRPHLVNFAWSFLALATVMAVGTVGYRLIGGPQNSWLDCFYMTFITVATIGYGEIIDLSHNPAGRVFTMFISVAGIGVLTYMLSNLTAFLLEGKINEALWRKRMEKHIHKLKGHYVVCGIGRVGRNVAHELERTGRAYVVIDENTVSIETHLEKYPDTMFVHGDASDDDILHKGHAETAAGLFAVTGDDSKNLLITLTAKQINPALRVVARCHEVRNIEKLHKVGADAIVSPDFTGGLRIASAMIRPQVVTFLDEMLKSETNLRLEEIVVPSGFPEAPLGTLNLRNRDFILLAIRDHERWRFNPGEHEVVKPGNVLVVMATPTGRQSIERMVGWV
ncbi:MAG: NAD-binding protein [Betaproteobacteria bacterium]|nr:NAD-binding protein [Betaproteobacteria bacterium]